MLNPVLIRIFFAIDVPGDLKKQVKKYLNHLKKATRNKPIRWINPENLHITLQFLPALNEVHLAGLIKIVTFELETIEPCQSIKIIPALKLFPNPYRPRVIVCESEANSSLALIASKIAKGIQNIHYPVEDRPFRAHLTLGRIKNNHQLNLDFLAVAEDFPLLELPVKEVVLFKSEPGTNGSHYSILKKFPLKQ